LPDVDDENLFQLASGENAPQVSEDLSEIAVSDSQAIEGSGQAAPDTSSATDEPPKETGQA
jgi:hypothetical protein